MPVEKTVAENIYNKLHEAEWPNLVLSRNKKSLKCEKHDVLSFSNKDNNYKLSFLSYNSEKKEINKRLKYKEIINPLNKKVNKIKIISTSNDELKISRNILHISQDIFSKVIKDAELIYKSSKSHAQSFENYLANIKSEIYYNTRQKRRTTCVEKGDFSFMVDRLNLPIKKNKKDIDPYIDNEDLKALEQLTDFLIRNEAFDDSFLRKLDDYFIKEKLDYIIYLGKQIIKITGTSLDKPKIKEIISQLQSGEIKQLEGLWQKFFEKYLLYLIFSYKKIFPKVKLKNIEGKKKYPDFIGINHYHGLDVIEIKTHLKNVLVWDNNHENFYFSPELSKSIVQTTNYMDAITRVRFQNTADKNNIIDSIDEENLYHPRGIIIISSEKKLTTKKDKTEELKRDFTKLRNGLNNIQIITFDEILSIADEYIKNINK